MLNSENQKFLAPIQLDNYTLSSRVLKLTTLCKDGTPYRNSSGFIIKYRDNALYLYTCWHVVTGIDFFEPDELPKQLPIPRSLRITGINVQMNGIEVTGLGGERSFEFPLYNKEGAPIWQQNNIKLREHYALNSIGIKVPESADIVRLEIQLPPQIEMSWAIDARHHVHWSHSQLFDPVTISGYPYGYSATKLEPTAIFLKRNIASWMTDNMIKRLLDGIGAPGMSGGPVWSVNNKLIGMYLGVIFPDYGTNTKIGKSNNQHTALGLFSPASMFLDRIMNNGKRRSDFT